MKIIHGKSLSLPKCTLINYANDTFKKLQKKNSRTGLKIGGFERVVSYSPSDLDSEFYFKNRDILDEERGNGYWLWKPYIIKKELININKGDYLFYCDSGSYFINSVQDLILTLNSVNQDIMPFELGFKESMWTKRDAFVLMGCDSSKFVNSNHRLATFILFKKSHTSLKFVDEWLLLSQDERIITDEENKCGLPNYEGFTENRHDQSIFSLLSKKYNLKAFRDPSQFGNYAINQYPNSKYYSQIIELTRLKKTTFKDKSKYFVTKCKKYLKSFYPE